MRIVHAASEMFPYVKTGGLADVVGALAPALAARGHEVEVYLPGYRALLEHPAAQAAEREAPFAFELGGRTVAGEIHTFRPQAGLAVHLVVRDEFFDRLHLYWNGRRDYDDNDARFIFFARAVVEAIRRGGRAIDAVHAHDWQTGLLPLLLREAARRDGRAWARRTVFTIHNIAYQGVFPAASFAFADLPTVYRGIEGGIEYHGQISLLKAGIAFADRVTTVSPNYAREIRVPGGGCGLDGVLRARGAAVSGVLNGIDTAVWNPAIDPALPAAYNADDLRGKQACRAALLRQVGWGEEFSGPVFGMISRMTAAKGHDLVLAVADFFRRHKARLVVLGSGDAAIEEAFRALAAKLPAKVAVSVRLDEKMSHLVEAGADFFLMPSRAEPCGLNQMYSQAYGTVPLCGRVGGLVDTVIDLREDPEAGTGFLLEPTEEGLRGALLAAMKLHADKPWLDAVRRRGMRRDFSWAKPVAAYEQLYKTEE
ncbi:MAG: glycogen synthase GlgA [Candidatus Didemnitutus sp.]|nr:glycogen synthase GlgA [Candidatus Didemnitutus sp.]